VTPVDPDERQLTEIAELAATHDGPIVMLNLNKYRDHAEYMRYGEVALRVLDRIGGRVLWRTDVKQTVIGDESDSYDEVIAVLYPSPAAFLSFATDEEIAAARAHRTSALERAALICCEPGDGVLA
jgi:uncharacterized protein (DUF1330 family)